jgi:pilus assembly protein Flp/PilA
MTDRCESDKRSTAGQGLVEYALIIVLIAIVVIIVLRMVGPIVGNVFSTIAAEIDGVVGDGGEAEGSPTGPTSPTDVVVIFRADYDSGAQELHIDATSDGDYDPGVTLTASPGGVMEARAHHYHLRFSLSGCPCTVTVTSSKGGSATVTVGP